MSTTRGPVLANFLVEVSGTASVPAPPVMNLTPAGGGQFQISWSGTGFVMQSATNVAGPWTDLVPAPASPFMVNPTNMSSYFRLRYSQ
jgi:hypothetical protein